MSSSSTEHLRVRSQRKSESGVALLYVVFVVAILSVFTLSILALTSGSRAIVNRANRIQNAERLAEAGMQFAVYDLIENESASAFLSKDNAKQIEFDGQKLDVSIEREDGKIDINDGGRSTLELALREFVTNVPDRQRLMAAAFDHRGSQDPSSGKFWSINQWASEAAVSDETAQCLDLWFTVHSGRKMPRPEGVTRELAQALVALEPSLYTSAAAAHPNDNHRPEAMAGIPILFRVHTVSLDLNSGLVAVVVLPGNQSGRYQIMRWDRVAGVSDHC